MMMKIQKIYRKIYQKIWSGIKRVLARIPKRQPREEIAQLLEESIRDSVGFDSQTRALLRNMLGLRDIKATDVMIPRADISYVDSTDNPDSVLEKMTKDGHSRVPVVAGNLDQVEGILHIKDVLRLVQDMQNKEKQKTDWTPLLRQPIFIAPSMRVLDLLQEMRIKRLHLALVVDEYGGTDGLITIEDLVEQIIGEIKDAHDHALSPQFDIADDGTALAEARLEIATLEAAVGRFMSVEARDEIDTLGGLVTALAGRVPGRGEIIRHPSGLEFEIVDSDPRHVSMVKIRHLNRVGGALAP